MEHIPLSHSPSLSHMHARTPPSRSARRFANFHKMVYNSNNIHHANPAWSRNATWKLTQTAYIADILLRPRVFSVVASPNRWSSLRLDSKKKKKKRAETKSNTCKRRLCHDVFVCFLLVEGFFFFHSTFRVMRARHQICRKILNFLSSRDTSPLVWGFTGTRRRWSAEVKKRFVSPQRAQICIGRKV